MKNTIKTITMSLRPALPAAALIAALATITTDLEAAFASGKWGGSSVNAEFYAGTAEHVTRGTYGLQAYAGGDGKFYSADLEIARANGQAMCYKDGLGRIIGSLRVIEQNVWSHDQSFNTDYSDTFSTVKTKEFVNITLPVPFPVIGTLPIDIDIRATIAAEVKLFTEFQPTPGDTAHPTITAGFTPKFESVVKNKLGIGGLGVGAGGEVDVTLVNLEMPAEASLKPKVQTTFPVITTGMVFTSTSSDQTPILIATFQDPELGAETDPVRTTTVEGAPTRTTTAPAPEMKKLATGGRKSSGTAVRRTATGSAMQAAEFLLTPKTVQTMTAVVTAVPYPEDEGQPFVASWSVDLTIDSLSGEVKAYAEAFGYETDVTLFRWNGYTETFNLTSGSKEILLGGGPPVALGETTTSG